MIPEMISLKLGLKLKRAVTALRKAAGEEPGEFRGGDPELLQEKKEEKQQEREESGEAEEAEAAEAADAEEVDFDEIAEMEEEKAEREASKAMISTPLTSAEVDAVNVDEADLRPRDANGDPLDIKPQQIRPFIEKTPPRPGPNQWKPWSEVVGFKLPLQGCPWAHLRQFTLRGDYAGAAEESRKLVRSILWTSPERQLEVVGTVYEKNLHKIKELAEKTIKEHKLNLSEKQYQEILRKLAGEVSFAGVSYALETYDGGDLPTVIYRCVETAQRSCLNDVLDSLGKLPSIKKANYKLQGRTEFQGLQISIENKKGSTRKWYDPHEDKHGETKMYYDYGYIRMTEGVDGDHVDVYLGPNPNATHAYVVHQRKAPDFKKFDEDKVMLGWNSPEEAQQAYIKQYDNPKFFGSMTTMPMEEFKKKVLKTKDNPKIIKSCDCR